MAKGINWGDWAALTYSTGTAITAIDVNDDATLTSDAISLDEKIAVEVSVKWVEGNDGAVDGDLFIHVLRDTDGTNYEALADRPVPYETIDVVQSATRYKTFTVYADQVSRFKVLVDNDSGRDGDLTMKVRYCTLDTVS